MANAQLSNHQFNRTVGIAARRVMPAAHDSEDGPRTQRTVELTTQFMAAKRALGLVALVVRDYEEALAFFVDVLGFELVEDTEIPAQGKRWVVVSPGGSGARLLLAKASSAEQAARVGAQAGGRVFLFLYTDDCSGEYSRLKALGVRFVREPERQPHGVVAVFEDLYGNLWDLIQPNATNRSWQW